MGPVRRPHHTFQPLAEGVRAGIAHPSGAAICNSGVVDLGETPLVFDTGMIPDVGRSLREASIAAFGRTPALVANSHWHLDHTLGNQGLPGIPIWGTRRTREILLEQRSAIEADLDRAGLERGLQELEARRDQGGSEGVLRDLEFLVRIQRALLAAAEPISPTPPDRTFDTRLVLPGSRGAELRSFGSGHTDADAVLWLPGERILFAGDLVVLGVQGSLGSGNPPHWLAVLDELERLRPEAIVPGHGPVTDVAGIDETRQYLRGVLSAAEAPRAAPLPAAIRRWEGSLSLEGNVSFARDWLAKQRSSGRP